MIITTVLWREWLFFKRRFWQITGSALVSPLLYLIAFGWGMGAGVVIKGHTYIEFIIPGIVALSTMNTSFNAVTIRILMSRLHEKSFELYLLAPVNMPLFATGQIIAGALRGMYAGILILLISLLFGVNLIIGPSFIMLMLLNSATFAAFGYASAMMIESHYDMTRFTTFVITPMTFLCGTFFSLDKMPFIVKELIYVLPLTHASLGMREAAFGQSFGFTSMGILGIYIFAFFLLGLKYSMKDSD